MRAVASTTRRTRRRRHAAVIGLAALASLLAVDRAFAHLPSRSRWSLATGYSALVAIAFTLAIGPVLRLSGRRVAVSFDARRDVGISAAALSAVHVVLAFGNHFGGRIRSYFMIGNRLRGGSFGLGVWTGVAATIVVAALGATSNDASLRRLGRRWKPLQRFNYALATLTVVHAAMFWVAEKRRAAFVGATLALSVGILCVRAAEFMLRARPTRDMGRRS